MKQALAVAPGAIWTAIILGLTLGAMWLNDYMGEVEPAWLPPLIITVIVPVLRVFVTGEEPAGVRLVGEVDTPPRSKFSRWLW